MARSNRFLPCLVLLAVGSSASAVSITSVSASAGSQSCSQSGITSASCTATLTNGSQTAQGSAFSTSTWNTTGSGKLEAFASGFGPDTTGQAAVSFSNLLLVTGATGTGDLQIVFTGFQMSFSNIPNSEAVTPVAFNLGSYSTTAILPNGSPQTFSIVAPVAFNTPTLFSVSFGASASGTFFHDGTYVTDNADGILQFPTFVVTDVTGAILPRGAVSFVPEPATWLIVALGLLALPLLRRSRRNAQL